MSTKEEKITLIKSHLEDLEKLQKIALDLLQKLIADLGKQPGKPVSRKNFTIMSETLENLRTSQQMHAQPVRRLVKFTGGDHGTDSTH